MSAVYKHRATGDLYAVTEGGFGNLVQWGSLERSFVLAPVIRLMCRETGKEAKDYPFPAEPYQLLIEQLCVALTVTDRQLAADFDELPDYYAMQNSDITEVLRSYTDENCDFSDLQWVADSALRLQEGLGNCQARCLLYVLANVVKRQLAGQAKTSSS
jgi:hypothetical protein